MTTRAIRRIGAVTAVATVAAGLAAGPAAAATKTHTALSIHSAARTVTVGAHDTISGSLRSAGAGVSGATVALEARPSGAHGFHQIATATTSPTGAVSFDVTPAHRTSYELLFSGTDKLARSHSRVITVAVRPATQIATTLSIRAQSKAVNPGGHDKIVGVLRAAHHRTLAGRTVTLQSRPTGTTTWTTGASKKTDRHGVVAFGVKPTQKTDYMLVFSGSGRFRSSQSGIVTVNVRIPTTLTLSASATSVAKGATDTLTGTLTTAAGPLAGEKVTLLARPAGRSHWSAVGTATSAANGTVSFTVTPTKTTSYVLVHPRNYTYTGARSGVVTVTVA